MDNIIDVHLGEVRGPADEFEVAGADIGHGVADYPAHLGHHGRRVRIHQHLQRDLAPDVHRVAVARGVQGDLDDQCAVLSYMAYQSELWGVLRQLSLVSPQEHDYLSLVQSHMLQVLDKHGALN